MTLRLLATFYGLDGAFLEELASWGEMEGGALRTALRDRTFELVTEAEAAELMDAPDELRLLALRAARSAGSTARRVSSPEGLPRGLVESLQSALRALGPSEQDDLVALLDGFGQLDRRRRRLLTALLADLQAGRDREAGL
jgi:hypothetical protein